MMVILLMLALGFVLGWSVKHLQCEAEAKQIMNEADKIIDDALYNEDETRL